MPVRPDELLPALIQGKGDIAAANLTITPERQQWVEFSEPLWTGVSELVVTGPGSPSVRSLDDPAGQEVFVRLSSSYFQSLWRPNQDFGRRAARRRRTSTPGPSTCARSSTVTSPTRSSTG